jgi:hypothetical protein
MAKWINKIPEIGATFRNRAEALEKRRAAVLAELESVDRAEAALFLEINNSGHYTNQEMTVALVALPFSVVKFLPDNMNAKKGRKKKAR